METLKKELIPRCLWIFIFYFLENIYNIPVSVWLEENYPQSAPICYVTPRREMMLLRGKYISMDSVVTFPYLDEWKAVSDPNFLPHYPKNSNDFNNRRWLNTLILWQGECDLVGLLQVMSAVFGDVPPVCMKPQQESQQISCKCLCHTDQIDLSNIKQNSFKACTMQ